MPPTTYGTISPHLAAPMALSPTTYPLLKIVSEAISICNCSTGANWSCSVGLLSSLALMVLSTCSEGADPIGPGPLTLRAAKDR